MREGCNSGVGIAPGSMGVYIGNVLPDIDIEAVVLIATPNDIWRNRFGERIRMLESGDRLHFSIRGTKEQLFTD